jgi:large subunit ribosomal protein L5
MYDFIDRLISIALPRSRDFHGLDPKSFDKQGSLSIGIKEHSIFPEITYESLKDIFGLEISVVTTAKSQEEGTELLKLMGFPIRI